MSVRSRKKKALELLRREQSVAVLKLANPPRSDQFIQFEGEPPIIFAEEPVIKPPEKTPLGIMGNRVIPTVEVGEWLGYDYGITNQTIDATMPSLEFLEANRGKGILVPGCPVTIADMQEKYPAYFTVGSKTEKVSKWFGRKQEIEKPVSWREFYGNSKTVCSDLVQRRWYFFNFSVIDGFFNKSFDEQNKNLPLGQKIPRACELAYVFLVCCLKFGSFLHLPLSKNLSPSKQDADSEKDEDKIFWHLNSSSLEILNKTERNIPMVCLGYNTKEKYIYLTNHTLRFSQSSINTSLLTYF